MPNPRFFAFIVLIFIPVGGQAVAQDRMRTSLGGEMLDGINPPGGYAPASRLAVSPPDAPRPQRVIDKKFIAIMGALAGAESLRFTSRKLVLDHEFAAGAPWVTSVPPNQHLVAKYAGIYAAELLVAYEIKRPHSWLPGGNVVRRLWWGYPAAMTAIHVKNGIGNIRTQGPGGCTSVECALQAQ